MTIVGMGAALGAGSDTFRLPPEYLFVGKLAPSFRTVVAEPRPESS